MNNDDKTPVAASNFPANFSYEELLEFLLRISSPSDDGGALDFSVRNISSPSIGQTAVDPNPFDDSQLLPPPPEVIAWLRQVEAWADMNKANLDAIRQLMTHSSLSRETDGD